MTLYRENVWKIVRLGRLVLLLLVATATATVPVPAPQKMVTFMPTAFGISKHLVNIRGGAVAEPATLQDVEAVLLKASSEGKLVVIDFSASWCGPCKLIAPLVRTHCEN